MRGLTRRPSARGQRRSRAQTKSSWTARTLARSSGLRLLLVWVLIENVRERLPSAVPAANWV